MYMIVVFDCFWFVEFLGFFLLFGVGGGEEVVFQDKFFLELICSYIKVVGSFLNFGGDRKYLIILFFLFVRFWRQLYWCQQGVRFFGIQVMVLGIIMFYVFQVVLFVQGCLVILGLRCWGSLCLQEVSIQLCFD